MTSYRSGQPQKGLEPWPFGGDVSNYVIVRGNPRASGRMDRGTGDSATALAFGTAPKGHSNAPNVATNCRPSYRAACA